MTQNIYDNEAFFAAYGQLERSVEGLHGAAEWSVLQGMLPAMNGLNVLDLGCGYGWFCRWARQNGAAHVLGIDVSERMLTRSRETTRDDQITYTKADLEHLILSGEKFDLVYSSLVFHYIEDLNALVGKIYASLVPGGTLVFSVEHPIYTAPADQSWLVDAAGRKTWPVNGYLNEGPRSTDWLAKGVIKQHRMMSTYINLLRNLGFTLSQVEEWGPTHEQIAARPGLTGDHERPPFLLVSARR